MIVKSTLNDGEKITEDQLKEIEAAKKMPIVYDEDSPELTEEMEKAFLVAARSRNRYKTLIKA